MELSGANSFGENFNFTFAAEPVCCHVVLALMLNNCYILFLFGHICRMDNSRKIKTLVFRMMDGSNKRGRPHREWSDDIEQWCGATLQELSHAALDRQRWAAIVTMVSDTNGR